MTEARSRWHYALVALVVVALGLATRQLKHVNDAVGSALGDALWAALVYLLLVLVFPRLRPVWALCSATAIAGIVEVSQLWHVSWLDTLRRTTLGALAVGGTFSIGDLWCYLAGTMGVFLVELLRANPSSIKVRR